MFEQLLDSWDKLHLVMLYDPFNVLLDSICYVVLSTNYLHKVFFFFFFHIKPRSDFEVAMSFERH